MDACADLRSDEKFPRPHDEGIAPVKRLLEMSISAKFIGLAAPPTIDGVAREGESGAGGSGPVRALCDRERCVSAGRVRREGRKVPVKELWLRSRLWRDPVRGGMLPVRRLPARWSVVRKRRQERGGIVPERELWERESVSREGVAQEAGDAKREEGMLPVMSLWERSRRVKEGREEKRRWGIVPCGYEDMGGFVRCLRCSRNVEGGRILMRRKKGERDDGWWKTLYLSHPFPSLLTASSPEGYSSEAIQTPPCRPRTAPRTTCSSCPGHRSPPSPVGSTNGPLPCCCGET